MAHRLVASTALSALALLALGPILCSSLPLFPLGYRPLLDAAKTFAHDKPECASKGGYGEKKGCCGSCPNKGKGQAELADVEEVVSCTTSKLSNIPAVDISTPVFPPELSQRPPTSMCFEEQGAKWIRPSSLGELLALKKLYPEAKLIVGNTEVGIEMKFKNLHYPVLIQPTNIAELTVREVVEEETFRGVRVGASLTLSEFKKFLEGVIQERKEGEIHGLKAIVLMLKWFASNHIRNAASIAGNVATASPISDLNPLLYCAGATLELASTAGKREVKVSEFFLAYRKVALQPNELIVAVKIPFTRDLEYVMPFKQAKRREDDISIVTSGMRLRLQRKDTLVIIEECCFAFGGMAPTTIDAKKTAAFLQGKAFSKENVEEAIALLAEELRLKENVPGGMAEYRPSLCVGFLFKFFSKLSQQWDLPDVIDGPAPSDGFMMEERPISSGVQRYPKSRLSAVGQNIPHKSAPLQVSGVAKYTDDIPSPPGTLHAYLVLSTCAHGKILSIDSAAAKSVDGFVALYTAADVPGDNQVGPVTPDEECFITETVTAVGQIIGIVLATSAVSAEKAAKLVKVTYEELPAIFSIQEAIAAQSFFPVEHRIDSGDIEEGFAAADVIVEGDLNIGGQEHFYLETNAALCIPEEQHGMTIISSTQNPSETQHLVAHVLGMPHNRIVSKVKRLGGGFGGKETRSAIIAMAASVAAYRQQKPVRIALDRDVDMMITGTRHPFYGKYKVGATKDGKLVAADLLLYCNAGYSQDLSFAVCDRALFHCENAYLIPNMRTVGKVCKTNIASNTAFRGFGGPQGMMVAETYMDHLAVELGIPVRELRERNLYKEGDLTHYHELLEHCTLQRLWASAMGGGELARREAEVEAFNKQNKWKKRGIAVIPTKFGISFTAKFMNQGGALVNVYTDGTVLVTHGGCEMGQGLHTKVIQIAAETFEVSHEDVHVNDTSTDKVPNSSPSAASMSSDLYGMAVLNACKQINDRLKPIRDTMPGADFKQIVLKAYMERVDLSAHGFYVVPGDRCGYNWDLETKNNAERGKPFNYFTYGVATAEVEMDVLTGDSHVRSVEIHMDVGKSLNPGLDIGQIEGAFAQGFGMFTIEEMVWGDRAHSWAKPGVLFTRGPGAYKIPSFNDTPLDYRITLLKDAVNPFAVHSSKGIGEPPLFLASSVFFALKHAILSARRDSGVDGYFLLNSPATPEKIRVACRDKFISMFAINGAEVVPKGSW